jgi:hydroxyacylglutathione hydrolase
MILERSTNPQFISNTYLVADGNGGPAFFIDAGGPVAPLIEAAERLGLEPTHVLLTHHHYDHVSEVGALRERWPALQVLASPREAELLGQAAIAGAGDGELGVLDAGDVLRFGELQLRALPTPGHTAGMLSFVLEPSGDANVSEADAAQRNGAVFTGDTLFKDSVGGVRAPGHSTYADLRASIMDTLMQLPPATVIYPGHAEQTTVEREWESNPFIRVWRGVDPEGSSECVALGEPATLVLQCADYDGGTKAWVRWQDGADDIVPGSQLKSPG